MLWRLLQNAATVLAYVVIPPMAGATRGDDDHRVASFDCCDCGRQTVLERGQVTRCCASRQFVPSASVLSRKVRLRPSARRAGRHIPLDYRTV